MAEVQITDITIGVDLAVWMRDRFGDPDPVCAVGNPVGKLSQLGKRKRKEASGIHRGKTYQTKALADQIPVKSLDVPPEELRRRSIVAETEIGLAEDVIRHDPVAESPEGFGNGEGALP